MGERMDQREQEAGMQATSTRAAECEAGSDAACEAPPARLTPLRSLGLLTAMAMHAAPVVVLLWLLMVLTPQYMLSFEAQRVELPALTQFVMNLARFVGAWAFLLLPLIMILAVVDGVVLLRLARSGRALALWLMALFGLILLGGLSLLCGLGLYLPMLAMLRGASG